MRPIGTDDETFIELTVLAGYDDDLAALPLVLVGEVRLQIHAAQLVGQGLTGWAAGVCTSDAKRSWTEVDLRPP